MKKVLQIFLKIIIAVLIFIFSSFIFLWLTFSIVKTGMCGCPGGCGGDISHMVMCDCLCTSVFGYTFTPKTSGWVTGVSYSISILIPLALSILYIVKTKEKRKLPDKRIEYFTKKK